MNALDPKINKGPWTKEQDQKLLENVEKFGKGQSVCNKGHSVPLSIGREPVAISQAVHLERHISSLPLVISVLIFLRQV